MLCWRDCVDDDQLTAATWTRQCENTRRLIGIADAVVIGAFLVWRFGPEQASDPRDIGGTIAIAVKTIVTDAVLASGEHMDQESTDEFICGQGHGGVAACAFEAVIFDAKGDAALIEPDQAAVGDRNSVGVARSYASTALGPAKGSLA